MEQESMSEQPEQRRESLPAPRGRPWLKGQSGNPAGRPGKLDAATLNAVAADMAEQAQAAAIVAADLITCQTVPLTRKLIQLALAGDRTALRLCVERVAPARRQAPIVAPIEASGDARAAIAIVADAAAAGVITSAQAAMLARMLLTICGPANGSKDHCDEQSDDAISRDE